MPFSVKANIRDKYKQQENYYYDLQTKCSKEKASFRDLSENYRVNNFYYCIDNSNQAVYEYSDTAYQSIRFLGYLI